jgi:hypothetical protein
MDADDRMVAGALLVRGQRVAGMALIVGGGGLLSSALPHTGLPLPAAIYGICSVVPVVLGASAMAGALLSARTFRGHPPGVVEALRSRGVLPVYLRAVIGALLGALAVLSGLLSLWLMQPVGPI